MDGRFINNNPFGEQEEYDNNQDNVAESPSSTFFNDMMKITNSTSSPRKGKRAIQKRVVSVPIKDVEGSRLKGESNSPPSDSWAWRKYGQKPIKGSPYPRGYYRCSSSKGCPARKQVERSRVDPTMLVVTYSCEHNHPWPVSRNHHNNNNHNNNHHSTVKPDTKPEILNVKPDPEPVPEETFANLGNDETSLIISTNDEFRWFSDMETTSSTVLESPIFAKRTCLKISMKRPGSEGLSSARMVVATSTAVATSSSFVVPIAANVAPRKDAMMHKPILDDRKKKFRGLTIHKNGAISSSKIDDSDLWEMWKTSQSISNLGSIDNKVVKLRIYSLGWGCTVQTDKIHLWRLVKRVLISQLYESSNVYENKDRKKKRLNDMVITQFLKSQADIDHLMYKELCKIVTRLMANAAGKQLMPD